MLSELRCLNDFKLLNLSWVYDINFSSTMREAVKRGVLKRIADTLPMDPETAKAVSCAMDFVTLKAAQGQIS